MILPTVATTVSLIRPSCMPRDAALAVAFTTTPYANSIPQAHLQQYVIHAHPRLIPPSSR
jgi:hypothetical protein